MSRRSSPVGSTGIGRRRSHRRRRKRTVRLGLCQQRCRLPQRLLLRLDPPRESQPLDPVLRPSPQPDVGAARVHRDERRVVGGRAVRGRKQPRDGLRVLLVERREGRAGAQRGDGVWPRRGVFRRVDPGDGPEASDEVDVGDAVHAEEGGVAGDEAALLLLRVGTLSGAARKHRAASAAHDAAAVAGDRAADAPAPVPVLAVDAASGRGQQLLARRLLGGEQLPPGLLQLLGERAHLAEDRHSGVGEAAPPGHLDHEAGPGVLEEVAGVHGERAEVEDGEAGAVRGEVDEGGEGVAGAAVLGGVFFFFFFERVFF